MTITNISKRSCQLALVVLCYLKVLGSGTPLIARTQSAFGSQVNSSDLIQIERGHVDDYLRQVQSLTADDMWYDDTNRTFYGQKVNQKFVFNLKFNKTSKVKTQSITCASNEKYLNDIASTALYTMLSSVLNTWSLLKHELLNEYYNNAGAVVYNQRQERWTFCARIAWPDPSSLFYPFSPCYVRVCCAYNALGIGAFNRTPIANEDYIPLETIPYLVEEARKELGLSPMTTTRYQNHKIGVKVSSECTSHSRKVKNVNSVQNSLREEAVVVVPLLQFGCDDYTNNCKYCESKRKLIIIQRN